MLDHLSAAGLEIPVGQDEQSSASFGHYHRVPFGGGAAVLLTVDLMGSILAAAVIFRIYATPLNYAQTQLWAGSYAFGVGWAVAASTLALYSKNALLADIRSHCHRALSSCALAFGIVLLLAFALNFTGSISRIWLLTWASSVFVWVIIPRIVWARYLRAAFRCGGCIERVAVFAITSEFARGIGEEIVRGSRGRVAIVTASGIPGERNGPSIDSIETAVKQGAIDRVVIAGDHYAVAQAQSLVEILARVDVDVTIIPSLGCLQTAALNVGRIGMLPAIDISVRPLSPAQVVLKRVEDLVVASLILLVTAPIFVLVSTAIKLDSHGPVLFGQSREGYHGRKFKVWKFRTMDHSARDEKAVRQTSRGDRRVTRVGRILRRLSIDELPQIINVLRGDMSIVGPRPHALGMTALGTPMHQVIEGYAARHRLKPGITGLAQVSGCRGEIDSHEKLRRRVTLDCDYINRWSLSLDVWIIARTAALLLFDDDAY